MKLLSPLKEKFAQIFSPQAKKLKRFQKQHQLDKYLVSSFNKSKLPSLKQLKHLTKVLNPRERRKIIGAFAFVGLAVVILIIQGYLLLTTTIPRVGGEYSEGLIGAPRFINPILATTNDVDADLSRLIFSGLLRRDSNNQLVPDLATSYEISTDQLTYTFHLRTNVKWHDGEKFKADDVIFTIAAIQDPEFRSPLSRSFRGIIAEKIDDATVKFTLKEPFAPFLELLMVGILPEHLWYNIPANTADLAELNKQPIGTGPWQFDSFKKDRTGNIKSYTLTPNADYYGQKPYLQKIIFKFYNDFISAIDAFKSKEVMAIAYLPQDLKIELKKYKNLNYHELSQPQYTAIFFNQKKNELLEADYIRQALTLAIDKQKIITEAFNGNGTAIDGPILPGIEMASDIKKYNYDPQGAVTLLEKNGWNMQSTTTADGISEQIRVKKSWVLTITLTTVNQPENVKAAEIIKKLWGQIGVKTELRIVDKSKIVQDVIKNRDYEALLFGENIGADPDPFPFWHSSQNSYPGLNLAIFSNHQADTLLEEARKTNDWEIRKRDYTAFQKIIAEQLPAVFLCNSTYLYPQDKKIRGFNLSGITTPADRFANINKWYINTRRVAK